MTAITSMIGQQTTFRPVKKKPKMSSEDTKTARISHELMMLKTVHAGFISTDKKMQLIGLGVSLKQLEAIESNRERLLGGMPGCPYITVPDQLKSRRLSYDQMELKIYPKSTSRTVLKPPFKSKFYGKIRDQGSIIWRSFIPISANDVTNLVSHLTKFEQAIHINTGTHGNRLGKNVFEAQDSELAEGVFLKEDLEQVCTKYKNISFMVVTKLSPQIYPEKADHIIDAWCNAALYKIAGPGLSQDYMFSTLYAAAESSAPARSRVAEEDYSEEEVERLFNEVLNLKYHETFEDKFRKIKLLLTNDQYEDVVDYLLENGEGLERQLFEKVQQEYSEDVRQVLLEALCFHENKRGLELAESWSEEKVIEIQMDTVLMAIQESQYAEAAKILLGSSKKLEILRLIKDQLTLLQNNRLLDILGTEEEKNCLDFSIDTLIEEKQFEHIAERLCFSWKKSDQESIQIIIEKLGFSFDTICLGDILIKNHVNKGHDIVSEFFPEKISKFVFGKLGEIVNRVRASSEPIFISRVDTANEIISCALTQECEQQIYVLKGKHNGDHRGFGLEHILAQHPEIAGALGVEKGDIVAVAREVTRLINGEFEGYHIKPNSVKPVFRHPETKVLLEIGYSDEEWSFGGDFGVKPEIPGKAIIQINIVNDKKLSWFL